MGRITKGVAAIAALAGVAGAGGCGAKPEVTRSPAALRTVYTAMPLGPESDPAGQDIVDAQRMAIAERGGRAGAFRVRLIARTSADAFGGPSPERAISAAQQAARSDNSLAYIGNYTSTQTAAAAPILNRAELVQVTPTSTAVSLTATAPGSTRPPRAVAPTGIRTLVRLAPSDAAQAQATVAYMQEESVKRLAIADDGDIYGRGLADDVARDARKAGIRVAGRVRIEDPSPKASAKRAVALAPDALFIGANSSPAAKSFIKAFTQSNPEALIFLPDGLSERPLLRALGDAELRTYVTNFVLPVSYYGPRGVRFVDRFRSRYRRDPSPFALYGFEAMSLVLDAIEAMPSGNGLGLLGQRRFVARRILSTQDRAAAIGSYSVTPTGDVDTGLYGAFRVEDGRLVRGRAVTIGATR